MTNYYYCPDCDESWEEEWDSYVESRCPTCDKTYTPFDSEEDYINAITINSIKFIKES